MQKLSVLGLAFAMLLVVAGCGGGRSEAVAVTEDLSGRVDSAQPAGDLDDLLAQEAAADDPAGEGAAVEGGATSVAQPAASGSKTSTTTAASGPAGTVTLRLNLPKDGKYKYVTDTQSEGTAMGQSMNTKATIEQAIAVKEQRGDKTRVEIRITEAKMDVPAEAQAQMRPEAMVEQMKKFAWEADYDSLGNETNTKVTGGGETMRALTGGSGLGYLGIIFPQGAVKAGSTWSGSLDLARMLGPMGNMAKVKSGGTAPVKYTLKSIDTAGGRTIATIDILVNGKMELAITMPGPDGKTTEQAISFVVDSSGTAKLNVATGVPESVVSDGKMVMTMQGMTMNQRMRSNMRLVR